MFTYIGLMPAASLAYDPNSSPRFPDMIKDCTPLRRITEPARLSPKQTG